jgi:NADH pyrophosphatase NudC (nudix superfamily)
MDCSDDAVPKPQQEEGITEAKWMNKDEVENALPQAYVSIAQLVRQYYLTN